MNFGTSNNTFRQLMGNGLTYRVPPFQRDYSWGADEWDDGYLDPVSLVPQSKLTLNRHNDRFYQHYLVPLHALPQRGLNASEHLLRKAFQWFRERIKHRTGDNGEAIARFVDAMVDKLFFTVITVTDELNAFRVFETLNARGVRLYAALRSPAKDSRNKKVVRFILSELEARASGQAIERESTKYDIEHVLPQNPGEDWPQFDEQQYHQCVYRLGNLTLLTAKNNRDLANVAFDKKRATYRDSPFAITRELNADYAEWTAEQVRARQLWMAKQATAIWRIAF